MWATSNPALRNDDAFQQFYGEMAGTKSTVTTLQGVVNKTGILTGIAVLTGCAGYWMVGVNSSLIFITWIAATVITLGLYFVIRGKPQAAPVLAPIYAAVEGVFLGALTRVVEFMLANQGLKVTGGVALQAFIITVSALVAMLILYRAGLVRPTAMLKSIIFTATGGIMLCYLLSWPLGLIFGIDLPLISFGAAFNDQGAMGLLGLGVNLVVLGIASLWLVIDFGMIEEKVSEGAPKYMEWYCGFALLVTLAWIYYEAVKLVVRLAALFGSRD